MELKPGYKQTEVGVIPEDWELLPLGSLANLDIGLSKPKIVFGSGCPVVTVQDLYAGSTINTDMLKRVVVTADEIERYRLAANDILIGNASVKRDGIGYSNIFVGSNEDVIFAKYAYRARTLQKVTPIYLHYVLRSKFCRHWIISKSQTGTLTNLNGASVRAVPIPVPPLPEQKAIAQALSDMDTLISGLDDLIAKKRDIKQATMQQLLTGKTRLPGFSGDWEVKRLGDVADCLDNLRIPLNEAQRQSMKGDYPYCGANGVLGFVDRYVIDDDIILMAEDGGYFDEYETRPIAYRMVGKCWVNNHAHILKARPGFDQGFIFYSIVHKNILPFLASGTRAKLNKSEMYKIELVAPVSPIEQKAIATVLTDIDDELAALEQRREKTRELKQAMMQELLTGRTRLV
jgi:type I restriction enzyme S subunit